MYPILSGKPNECVGSIQLRYALALNNRPSRGMKLSDQIDDLEYCVVGGGGASEKVEEKLHKNKETAGNFSKISIRKEKKQRTGLLVDEAFQSFFPRDEGVIELKCRPGVVVDINCKRLNENTGVGYSQGNRKKMQDDQAAGSFNLEVEDADPIVVNYWIVADGHGRDGTKQAENVIKKLPEYLKNQLQKCLQDPCGLNHLNIFNALKIASVSFDRIECAKDENNRDLRRRG